MDHESGLSGTITQDWAWAVINFAAEPKRAHDDVVRLREEAAALLDLSFDKARVEVVSGHASPAYGVPHAATWDAIALAGRLEALVLDPVYTGKALQWGRTKLTG